MIHYLNVACADCKAKVGEPCKNALYPHRARRDLRDTLRKAEKA